MNYEDDNDTGGYYKAGEEIKENLAGDYAAQLSSHAYMPKEFLGIQTESLGFFVKGQQESPFITLKRKLIEEAGTLKLEDRMQGVRYLCNIPYNNSTFHCVEAALSIVKDDSVDVYKRFYFFNNKDKFFRLNDHVVNMLHPAFFSYGLKQGPIKVPFELLIISAKYIMLNYGIDTNIRQVVLDWMLDITDNPNEDEYTQIQVLQTLFEVGQPDEQSFADDQLKMKGLGRGAEFTLEESDEMARGILRYLRTTHKLAETSSPKEMFRECVQFIRKNDNEPGLLKFLEGYFSNTISGNYSFETVSVADIVTLLQIHIEVLRAESSHMAEEVIRRFIDNAKQGFEGSMELGTNILLSLEGFVTPKPLSLLPSLYEQLRNDLFAGLNQSMCNLNPGLREEVMASRRDTDKSVAREFLVYFDDELDLLRKEYMKKHKMNTKEFDDLSTKIMEEWLA